MVDGLRRGARARLRLTVLTALAFAALPAAASAALPDAGDAVDRALPTATAGTDVPLTVPRPAVEETAATATPVVDTVVDSVEDARAGAVVDSVEDAEVGTVVDSVENGEVGAVVGSAVASVEKSHRHVESTLEGTAEQAGTLHLSPRVTDGVGADGPRSAAAMPPADAGGAPAVAPHQTPARARPADLGDGGRATVAGLPAPASEDRGASPSTSLFPSIGAPGLHVQVSAGSVSGSPPPGEEPASRDRAPAAGAGPGGGTSAPPPIAVVLLLAAVATPIFIHAFKEAPVSLRPAPFIALLERPG